MYHRTQRVGSTLDVFGPELIVFPYHLAMVIGVALYCLCKIFFADLVPSIIFLCHEPVQQPTITTATSITALETSFNKSFTLTSIFHATSPDQPHASPTHNSRRMMSPPPETTPPAPEVFDVSHSERTVPLSPSSRPQHSLPANTSPCQPSRSMVSSQQSDASSEPEVTGGTTAKVVYRNVGRKPRTKGTTQRSFQTKIVHMGTVSSRHFTSRRMAIRKMSFFFNEQNRVNIL